jgi:hypothetical protein
LGTNLGCWVLRTGYWVWGAGHWVLAIGTGYWVLGAGYWLLGIGHWVLGTKPSSRVSVFWAWAQPTILTLGPGMPDGFQYQIGMQVAYSKSYNKQGLLDHGGLMLKACCFEPSRMCCITSKLVVPCSSAAVVFAVSFLACCSYVFLWPEIGDPEFGPRWSLPGGGGRRLLDT